MPPHSAVSLGLTAQTLINLFASRLSLDAEMNQDSDGEAKPHRTAGRQSRDHGKHEAALTYSGASRERDVIRLRWSNVAISVNSSWRHASATS